MTATVLTPATRPRHHLLALLFAMKICPLFLAGADEAPSLFFPFDFSLIPSKNATEKEKEDFQRKQQEKIRELLAPYTNQKSEKTDKIIGEKVRTARAASDLDVMLKGVAELSVSVFVNSKLLSQPELQTKVELNLRKNGVKLRKTLSFPSLQVIVETMEVRGGYIYTTYIHVRDIGYIERPDGFTSGPVVIWSYAGDIGCGPGGSTTKSAITEAVIRGTEAFCNAYLSQNDETVTRPTGTGASQQKKNR